jgi:hypothetical protein
MRLSILRSSLFLLLVLAAAGAVRAQDAPSGPAGAVKHIDDHNAFVVQQVERDTVLVNGGKDAGLAEGMTLVIKRSGRYYTASGGEFHGTIIVALLEVKSVSNTSAMCEVHARNQEIKRGDIAWLSSTAAKPEHKPPQVSAPAPEPWVDPTKPQPSSGGFWTTPGQKPPQGVNPMPELSVAERARLARAANDTANQPRPPSTDEVIPPLVTRANTANSSGTAARANATDASSTVSPTVFPTVSPNSIPAAGNGQPNPAQPAPSVAERARLARSERASRNQVAQAANPAAQPVTEGPTSVAPATKPPDAVATNASTAVVSEPVAVPPAPVSSPSALPSTTPAAASITVTADVHTKPSTTPVAQPSIPVVTAKADKVQPSADTSVASAPVAPVAVAKAIPPVAMPPVSSTNTSPTTPPAMAPSPHGVNESGGTAAVNTVPMRVQAPSTPSTLRTTFRVKYVAADALYIEGGKDAGLVEGMTLAVEHLSDPNSAANGPLKTAGDNVAEVVVVSVSNTSAVCEIRAKSADIQRGDLAVLSKTDQDKLAQANTLGPTRKYPMVIAFSEGDPLDEEQREVVPKPPLPEINRARGRIGLDYTFINSTGTSTVNTAQVGGVIRIDMSRIGGSYWNLNGYWRGRLNAFSSSSTQTQSVYDLVNRTYTLGFTYMNPGSQWTAGVGRLYLPWATSLDTLDGGYVGRRFGKHTIVGAFAGTDPDPTSFNYNPDLRTAGSFVAFEAGSFDSLRFTSTEGIAVSSIEWAENRQFVFNETGLFYKRYLSIYNATQVDKAHLPTGGLTEGLSRSFSTLRVQPFSRFSIDVNHSYFRDVPTFSAALISTGLLDKYLFQGLSVGSRIELPGRISLYGNFGQSNRSGDTHSSLNQLYGVTLGRLWFTGIRADVRYSKFASSFGSGNYRALSLSRSFKEAMRLEVNAGKQSFVSSIAVPTDYRLVGSTLDLNLGSHYFLETVFNAQRGLQQSYNQWIITTGYRFDTKRGK